MRVRNTFGHFTKTWWNKKLGTKGVAIKVVFIYFLIENMRVKGKKVEYLQLLIISTCPTFFKEMFYQEWGQEIPLDSSQILDGTKRVEIKIVFMCKELLKNQTITIGMSYL